MVQVKEVVKCDSETVALQETEAGAAPSSSSLLNKLRRVTDFSIVDDAGVAEPIEALQFSSKQLFLCGVIHPAEGPISKATGRRVERLGPLKSFSLDCSAKTDAVRLHSDAATYVALRPASSYKKVFANLAGQADITVEVVQAVTPHFGGNAQASLEEVVARLARSKTMKRFSTPREGLLLNGKFVLSQLAKIDADEASKGNSSGKSTLLLAATPFAKALADAVQGFKYVGGTGAVPASNKGIIIRDPIEKAAAEAAAAAAASETPATENDAQMVADEDFARQLQATMDVEARGRRTAPPKSSQAYIKVSEAEIADDYPAPAPYNKEEEEMDELLLYDEELAELDPEHLPRRLLTDFSIYNADGLMASLELLPMAAGVDADVELYASGVVVDDDGDFSGAQMLQDDEAGGASGASGSGSAAGAATTAAGSPSDAGMRMCLSQIREWVVEFGADMLFMSIRTDVAWYRLSVPAQRYKPWFDVVLKCARISARVLGMLSQETRASKISFTDVVKRFAKDEETSPTFVAKRPDSVERFLAVHGQILLSCFSNFPVKAVRNSAFATTLKEKLAAVRHSKLYRNGTAHSKSGGKVANRNPMRDRAAGARAKPMTATATTMVKSIWQVYFTEISKAAAAAGDAAAGDAAGATAGEEEGAVAQEVEEDMNEEENEEEEAETALAETQKSNRRAAAKSAKQAAHAHKSKLAWIGGPTRTVSGGVKFYSAFKLDGVEVALGDTIALVPENDEEDEDDAEDGEDDDDDDEPIGMVQCLWQTASGAKFVQVRVLMRGIDTVLGDAASDSEVFLTTDAESFPLTRVLAKLNVQRLDRCWDASRRTDYFAEDAALRARNEEAAKTGAALELFWRRQYIPQEGMFRDLPRELTLGTRLTEEEDDEEEDEDDDEENDVVEQGTHALADGNGFVKEGVAYHIGDFMFVGPEVFEQMPEAQRELTLPEYLSNSRFHKGSHVGLRAWGVGKLVKLGAAASTSKKSGKGGASSSSSSSSSKLTSITLQRFWRPEDISEEAAYQAQSYYDLFAGDEELTVAVDAVVGPVSVKPKGSAVDITSFVCVGSFSKKKKTFGPAPKELAAKDVEMMDAGAASTSAAAAAKGKTQQQQQQQCDGSDGIALATMDIFAGCGGLSEGMHQAGAAYAKWAIEYEVPAADAFKLNNPDAAVFANNCNVLLHAAMDKAGMESDCLASEEAVQASKNLPPADLAALPLPGEVDFICGGPPCQGYSGMNRFNKSNWSMVQNSMVMSFLSYADFYRPRYFLLENVRNFVSHNKSHTFRLTLRSLLDMGYQVRFGVLNAGNFGVAQSRKRTFIWAAAPGELLPDWPQLMHAFRTPQLTINLPGNVQYTAVPQTVRFF